MAWELLGFHVVEFGLNRGNTFELSIQRLLHRLDHLFETFDALAVIGRGAVSAD
jgi:hypothetical protein